MQRVARGGVLPPAVIAALTEADAHWNQDPAERRWWATLEAYRNWLDTHDGEHPSAEDDRAAGLHSWATGQQDQNLHLGQRTALRRLPGWTRTAEHPAWDDARQVINALLASGVAVTDPAIHPSLLVNATTTASQQALPASTAERRLLLTVLTFSVQTGRLPEHLEPGSRWQKHLAADVRAILPAHVFTRPRLIVQRRLEQKAALTRLRDDGLPYNEAALRAEETWHRRLRAQATRGELSDADTAALLAE